MEILTSGDFEVHTRHPRIVSIDIETAPIIGTAWRTYDTSLVWVVRDSYIIGISAKYLNGKQITRVLPDYPSYKKNPTDDRELIQEAWNILNDCDVAVAHNGRRFDFRRLNARFIINGLPPPKPYRIVDTFEVAKRGFGFTSNRLDDLGQYLGVGQKIKTDKELWRGCTELDDPKAWEKMRRYNKRDVVLLEKVYLALRPWMPSHPNLNVLNDRSEGCPNCGGKRLQSRGWAPPTAQGRRKLWHCQDCGAWPKGQYKRVATIS